MTVNPTGNLIIRGSEKQREWARNIQTQKMWEVKYERPDLAKKAIEIFLKERSAQYWINARNKHGLQIYKEKTGEQL